MNNVIAKSLIGITVTFSLFTACSSDNIIKENLTEGFWIENISKESFINRINKNQNEFNKKEDLNLSKETASFIENLPKLIEHYLVFENNRFKEYITLRKNKLVLIADFPASISENILTIYHPDNSGKVISTIEILDGMVLGHDVTQSFSFKLETFKKNNVSEKWSFTYYECLAACYATHAAIGISWADDICCFWYYPKPKK